MTDTAMNTLSDELTARLESALRDMPSINHGPLDKGDYSRAIKRLALAIHDTTSTLRSAHPAVRVKGLEWSQGWGERRAETPFGDYRLRTNTSGAFDWLSPDGEKHWASSEDKAKAAAQADYERRIRSPLYAAPSNPVVSDKRWPTREEAAQAASVLLRCNGFDLDQWGGGDIMDDAPGDALKALASLSVNPQIGSDKP